MPLETCPSKSYSWLRGNCSPGSKVFVLCGALCHGKHLILQMYLIMQMNLELHLQLRAQKKALWGFIYFPVYQTLVAYYQMFSYF